MKKVTQILCFYNEEKYLYNCIKALLNQTYTNLELILINDGSNDDSVNIVRQFEDPRIVLVDNDVNRGLAWTRNQGLDIATGDYIGFTDADDISLPDRIKLLVDYLDSHDDIDIVSSNCIYIDSDGNELPEYASDIPLTDKAIREQILFGNPILGPGAIFRSRLTKELHIRNDSTYRVSQDWHFWLQCLQHCKINMIPDKPYLYRIHQSKAQQFAKKNDEVQALWRSKIIQYGWKNIGVDLDDTEALFFYRYIYKQYSFKNPCTLIKGLLLKKKIARNLNVEDKSLIVREYRKRLFGSWIS